MVCTIPYNILGGIIVTTKQSYADNDFAVYQCNSGYVMSGTAYVTCKNGTWSAPPSCVQVARNQVSVNDTTEYNFPDWLVYFIACLCVILALAILTCLLVCCLQLFGCYGAGGLFGEPKGICICCRRNKRYERQCTIIPRKYGYDEDGRRFHYDDLGRRCFYIHRNRYLKHTAAVTPANEPNVRYVTVHEVHNDKKHGSVPAKEMNIWMPHTNPVRNINTSTK